MSEEANRSVFPLLSPSSGPEWGITKREFFAVIAMHALLSRPDCTGAAYRTAPQDALAQADELLAELEKPPEPAVAAPDAPDDDIPF